jgi:uncharacterized membrane protein YczE
MQSKTLKSLLRYTWIMLGLFVIANGIVMLVQAQLGVAPWDVLHLGISYQTGISIGRVMQGIGLILVLFSWIFHVKPSFVTLVNMFFLGYFVDLVMGFSYIPTPVVLWQKVAWCLLGVAIFGIGVAVYISANRGAGPRDSLMLALTKVTPLRVGAVRTLMEVTVAVLGYLLGGPLGVGTVVFALLVGVFMEFGFAGINVIKHSAQFKKLWFESVDGVRMGKN